MTSQVLWNGPDAALQSQSAFVRGFIDDLPALKGTHRTRACLNPRSCAASSMTPCVCYDFMGPDGSQSAFVRGFIDDGADQLKDGSHENVSIRVRARLHR